MFILADAILCYRAMSKYLNNQLRTSEDVKYVMYSLPSVPHGYLNICRTSFFNSEQVETVAIGTVPNSILDLSLKRNQHVLTLFHIHIAQLVRMPMLFQINGKSQGSYL